MITYKLNQVAKRPKGTSVLLPEIHGTLSAENAYLRVEREMLRKIAQKVRDDVLPVVESEMAGVKLQRQLQDIDNDVFTRLKEYATMLANVASGMVNRILNLESQKHTKQFVGSAKKALGIDLSAVVTEADLTQLLATAATRNANLIKSLSDDAVTRVSTSVTSALMTGKTAKELKADLVKQFGFTDRRAKVIARDQIAKLNSDLNRFRHQQAGISTYTWRTSADERVRPRHRALEGNVYEYGKPTGAEEGLPPGQPILCRCIAQALVEFGEETRFVAEEVQPAVAAPAPAPIVVPKAPLAPGAHYAKKKAAAAKKTAAEIAAINAKVAQEVKQTVAKFEAVPKPAPAKVAMPEWKLPTQLQQTQAAPTPALKPVVNSFAAEAQAAKAKLAQGIAFANEQKKLAAAAKKAAKLAAQVQAGIAKGEAFAAKQALLAKMPTPKPVIPKPAPTPVAAPSSKAIAARPFNPTKKSYHKIVEEISVIPTAGEKEAAKFYTGAGFRAVNGYLRGTSSASPLVKRLTKDLGALVDKTALAEDVLGYRGVGNLSDIAKVSKISDLIGAEIQDKAFVSVTTDPKIARGFALGNNKNPTPPPYGVMMEVRMAKGQKALPANEFTKHKSEKELILTSGAKFKVVDAVRNGLTIDNKQYDKLVVEYL